MAEFLQLILEHLFEIIIGGAILLTNLFGKPKSAEKLEQIYQKTLKKKQDTFNATVQKAKKLSEEIDTMKENHNGNRSL